MKNSNQTIKIKKATYKDINRFWNLFKISVKKQFPEYPIKVRKFFLEKYYTKNNLRQWVKKGIITLLIATNNNEIVGYLIANFPYGGVSSIIWLAVQNSFQNRGIGSALLKKYETIAKKKGIHKILLSMTNKQNLKFYKKNGYKLIGYIPQNYFGVDDWWLYKEIQTPNFRGNVLK
ncbi:hypothetical protein COX73_02255 [bacterium (Candidatus Gribaldobacteria) CG_4_10_14_0_2_um_filter_36_18]|uniref:N-acetyltransferase domain-containing protein n=1 Tax=bacterium (Candidatus Gribaldobacteria) CG_4_10_14_0_2_um_filter_36_18 TaxID=2014264 RepID=A0A2M7VKH2_9BACT|nr:MAG: hypothetical protein COX73_02255 [bacterium (Candidatus Gribaldobacteria) CG_4_10_14_0_2_um_filter_36_18]